jgi:hypothetical protein
MKKLSLTLFAFLLSVSVSLAQHNATTTQNGNNNTATVTQDGNKGANNTKIQQINDNNVADVTQHGDNSGPSPLDPNGFTNQTLIQQFGGSEAHVDQTGRDYVNLEQHSGSYADINQDYGKGQIVRGIDQKAAFQSGGAVLNVRQQGTLETGDNVRRLGSELRIRQQGGVLGDVTADVKQRDGAFAQVLQVNGFAANHSATIRQDGNSKIFLEQNASFSGATADLYQTGDGNLITGLDGGSSYAEQINGGSLTVHQISPYGTGAGAGNVAKVYQNGPGNSADITQNGTGNVSTVSQQ